MIRPCFYSKFLQFFRTPEYRKNQLPILCVKKDTTFDKFNEAIAQSTIEVQTLSRALRTLVFDVCPGVVEVPWPGQRLIGYGLGPKKMTEHFCYIAPFDQHVNLGFNYGSELADPGHLLEGTGKKFRHARIHKQADIARPALRKLLQAAVRERARALGRIR